MAVRHRADLARRGKGSLASAEISARFGCHGAGGGVLPDLEQVEAEGFNLRHDVESAARSRQAGRYGVRAAVLREERGDTVSLVPRKCPLIRIMYGSMTSWLSAGRLLSITGIRWPPDLPDAVSGEQPQFAGALHGRGPVADLQLGVDAA